VIVASVAVEQVHQRARQEEEVRRKAERMAPMLAHKPERPRRDCRARMSSARTHNQQVLVEPAKWPSRMRDLDFENP
jgi:hypothetical protein